MSDIIEFYEEITIYVYKEIRDFFKPKLWEKNNKYVDAGEMVKEKKQKEISYTITTKIKIAQIF